LRHLFFFVVVVVVRGLTAVNTILSSLLATVLLVAFFFAPRILRRILTASVINGHYFLVSFGILAKALAQAIEILQKGPKAFAELIRVHFFIHFAAPTFFTHAQFFL
jgi:hypothetical protein